MAGAAVRAEDRFFEIKAKKFSYTPNVITVNRGDNVRIRLLSEDVRHGIYVDGYGVRTTARPGRDGSLKFTADKPGRYTFRCSVTCGEFHPYMVGHLKVLPNSPFRLFGLVIAGIAVGAVIVAAASRTRGQENG